MNSTTMDSEIIITSKEVSKELEIISFNALKVSQFTDGKDDCVTIINKKGTKSSKSNKVSPETHKLHFKEPKTQLESFQNAMKLLFLFGQGIGLNPALNINGTDVPKIRFAIFSWRFVYCAILALGQSIALTLSLYRLIKNSISIGSLGYCSFYGSTCTTTYLFIQIGYRWPKLIRDISKCSLDEYVDPKIKNTCYITTATIIALSAIEHLLSLLHKIEHIVMCRIDSNAYEEFLRTQFPWYFELDVPMNMGIGVIFQVLNIITTLNWNYLDSYIICMSMYLASVLKKVNLKIIAASEKHYLPCSYWRLLREDYTRASRLVRSFDDVISGLVFTSFASNLFFICLQIFNILSHGVSFHTSKYACPRQISHGILGGYEYTVYLMFSVAFLLVKALLVSLVASSVNTASLVPAQALYCVPSSAYCDEVSRFIVQVNEDRVALSGLQFFYVTRDLVLTVAGTIVTYELVLLQFSGSDFK